MALCCVVKYFLLRFSLYFLCCYPLFLSPTLLCRQESSDYNNGGSSPLVLEPSFPVSHCPPQSAPGTSREEQLAHTQCWLDAQFQPTPCFTEESSHSRIREVTMRAIFGLTYCWVHRQTVTTQVCCHFLLRLLWQRDTKMLSDSWGKYEDNSPEESGPERNENHVQGTTVMSWSLVCHLGSFKSKNWWNTLQIQRWEQAHILFFLT